MVTTENPFQVLTVNPDLTVFTSLTTVSVGDGVDVPRMMFISSFGLKYVWRSQYTLLLTEPTPADTTQVLVW